jgi:uncharacterized protein (DUF1697 family)
MTTRVAFLRAINVGRRTVSMARLTAVFADLGYDDAWTHINSGNVVFDATGGRAALERKIETRLEAEFGFEITTFVRSGTELEKAIALKPFAIAARDTYFVTFLKAKPSAPDGRALEALSSSFDTLVVNGHDVHWRMRGKSTDSKLTSKHWTGIVGANASTSRNMNMLEKLADKLR